MHSLAGQNQGIQEVMGQVSCNDCKKFQEGFEATKRDILERKGEIESKMASHNNDMFKLMLKQDDLIKKIKIFKAAGDPEQVKILNKQLDEIKFKISLKADEVRKFNEEVVNPFKEELRDLLEKAKQCDKTKCPDPNSKPGIGVSSSEGDDKTYPSSSGGCGNCSMAFYNKTYPSSSGSCGNCSMTIYN